MTQNSKGLRGAPLIRSKTSEKIRKSKMFFMLLGAILTVVFEKVVFNPSKIIQGTFLGPFLFKKWFLER
jgi:hypothetical protein